MKSMVASIMVVSQTTVICTSVWYTELPRTLMEMAISNSDVRKGIIRLSNQLKLVGAAVSKSTFNKY